MGQQGIVRHFEMQSGDSLIGKELLLLTSDGTLYINAKEIGLTDDADTVVKMTREALQRAIFQGHFDMLERMP